MIFHDVRDEPLPPDVIARFLDRFGAALLNTRTTTWRNLPESERSRPAAELLAAHSALMKRPVIESGDLVTLGWSKEAERAHLG